MSTLDAEASNFGFRWRKSGATAGSTASRSSRPRTTSRRASPGRTASSASVQWPTVLHAEQRADGSLGGDTSALNFWPWSRRPTGIRLVTAPARSFLNSTFNETAGSRDKEGRPDLMMRPEDAAPLGLQDGDRIRIGNARGAVLLHLRVTEGLKPGVVIAEGIWPNEAYPDRKGINTLTGADAVAPYGGAAFHDIAVWVRKA
ncbi:MAG: hypothetical protein HPM95_17160 [Alphaproteobacteria bacterium]|nr:hypothetical protein [Alphaproteobacteria bacterium]